MTFSSSLVSKNHTITHPLLYYFLSVVFYFLFKSPPCNFISFFYCTLPSYSGPLEVCFHINSTPSPHFLAHFDFYKHAQSIVIFFVILCNTSILYILYFEIRPLYYFPFSICHYYHEPKGYL